MANEFIIRDGFISKYNVIISGSLSVTSVTGSIVTASYSITASNALNSVTASMVSSIPTSSFSTYSDTASYATTALNIPSYDINYTSTKLSASFNSTVNAIGYISPLYTFNIPNTINNGINNRQNNTIYLTPIYINSNCILSKIGIIALRTNSSVDNNIRLGIYSNSNTMLPGVKLSDDVVTPPANNTRNFYETSLSTPINLKAGEVYWIASMLCGSNLSSGVLSYTVLQWGTSGTEREFNRFPINRMFNPILGSQPPINQNAIRHISYYTYVTTATTSLESTLPQTPGSYTIYSYGSRDIASGIPINNVIYPPLLFVNY